uniref:Uncharacterized protein n=1 Tax=Tetranychus urticae TaxID=32264 RepID=T1KFG7_TETUR
MPILYQVGNCHYRFILDTIVTLKADWQNIIFNLTNWFGHSYNYIINTSTSHPIGNHQDNNFSPRINHQWPLLMDIIATHCFANFSNPKISSMVASSYQVTMDRAASIAFYKEIASSLLMDTKGYFN